MTEGLFKFFWAYLQLCRVALAFLGSATPGWSVPTTQTASPRSLDIPPHRSHDTCVLFPPPAFTVLPITLQLTCGRSCVFRQVQFRPPVNFVYEVPCPARAYHCYRYILFHFLDLLCAYACVLLQVSHRSCMCALVYLARSSPR